MFKHLKCGQAFRFLGGLLVHDCPKMDTLKANEWIRRQRYEDWLRFGK